MRFRPFITLVIAVISTFGINAQDIRFVREQLNHLCSHEFIGRGYYNKGDSISAVYLANQFKVFSRSPG